MDILLDVLGDRCYHYSGDIHHLDSERCTVKGAGMTPKMFDALVEAFNLQRAFFEFRGCDITPGNRRMMGTLTQAGYVKRFNSVYRVTGLGKQMLRQGGVKW